MPSARPTCADITVHVFRIRTAPVSADAIWTFRRLHGRVIRAGLTFRTFSARGYNAPEAALARGRKASGGQTILAHLGRGARGGGAKTGPARGGLGTTPR